MGSAHRNSIHGWGSLGLAEGDKWAQFGARLNEQTLPFVDPNWRHQVGSARHTKLRLATHNEIRVNGWLDS